MRSEIIRQLQSEYELQRAANTQEEAIRRQTAWQKSPEVAQLCRQREELISGGIRAILAGGRTAGDIPQRMEVLNKSITRELEKCGLPGNYLDPVYRCAICRDTGYVGEPVREMCSCMRSRFYQRLYEGIGLKEAEPQSFETYDDSIFSDQLLP